MSVQSLLDFAICLCIAIICSILAGCPDAHAYYVYNYIDKTGKSCIEHLRASEERDEFNERKDFHNGRALRSIYKVNFLFDPVAREATPSRSLFFIDKNAIESSGPFSWAQPFSDSVAAVIPAVKDSKDQVLSLIDIDGSVVGRTNMHSTPSRTWPAFVKIEPFHEGRAAVLTIAQQTPQQGVKSVAKWGFIDASGKWVIKPQFELASSFSDGLACVRAEIDGPADPVSHEKPKAWGYINTGGTFAIEPIYLHANPFSEKLAFVTRLDDRLLTGRRNETMRSQIDTKDLPKEEEPEMPESEGPIQEDFHVEYSVINTKGKVQFSTSDSRMSQPFRDGLSLMSLSSSYVDASGRITIEGKEFLEARSFSEGLACVKHRTTGKFGFIDRMGKLVIPANFERAGDFSEGLAAVMVEKLWGFIDKNGRLVIPARYLSVRPFSDGLAAVVTRKFTRHEFRKSLQGSMFQVFDPSTNEIRAQCSLVQISEKQRFLISSLKACGRNANKVSGELISEGGYAALRESGGGAVRELQLRGQSAVGAPGRIYGKIKVLKLIPTADFVVYEVPAAITREGIRLSTDIPAPTEIFGATEQNQLAINGGIGNLDCFISAADVGKSTAGTLNVKLKAAFSGRTFGGETLLNSNGELLGIAINYEFGSSTPLVRCLPSTAILRHLSGLSR